MASSTRRPGDPSVPPGPKARLAPISAVARETVTLQIDRGVLDHFQAQGPGWQERINAALREMVKAAGMDDPGKRPEELNAANDD